MFDQSNKVAQRYLLALFKPNQKSHARVGIIVGKRVANQAVARNQIKRIVRESFRANYERFQGLDIVIIARAQCDNLNKIQLREGIEQLWQKLAVQSQKASR
ncbi:MAG: ribonuclease P protein component [Gammaproteobacteria bacterium]|nr:ribonuclease P protein component [Gammaproteobacteria bacterium]